MSFSGPKCLGFPGLQAVREQVLLIQTVTATSSIDHGPINLQRIGVLHTSSIGLFLLTAQGNFRYAIKSSTVTLTVEIRLSQADPPRASVASSRLDARKIEFQQVMNPSGLPLCSGR